MSVNPPMQRAVAGSTRQVGRVILAGGIGSAVEWFDFGVYGYLAPVLGAKFFPSEDPVATTLSGFAVFCVGYLMRPVGGLLLGRLGDRMGRRTMLVASVVAMGLASLWIGVLPTYAQAGIVAPILLVLLRCVQGIAVGGEYTGAMAYTAESAPPGHRGLVSSMATIGVSIGLLAGSGAVALLHTLLTTEQVHAWGWRLPFLGSVFVGAVGLVLRARMPESDAFEARDGQAHEPFLRVLRSRWRVMLRVITVVVGANAAFYAGFVYMTDAFSDAMPELAGRAQWANSAMLAGQALLMALGGWLSDRWGRRRVSVVITLLLLSVAWPAWRQFTQGSLEGLVTAQVLLSIPLGLLFGIQGAMVAELCPAQARCAVYGVSYGTGIALFAGTVPVLATWMVGAMDWPDGPILYVLATVVISLITLTLLRPADLVSLDARA
ncbi:MAG: MFS transporter [Phycisphaerales bacterium]|jgi:MHS family proline/betaine transporter-like MFS transporter